MKISLSSIRSIAGIGRTARQSRRLTLRAERLLLHSSGRRNHAVRSRRLFVHVLRSLGVEPSPSADIAELGQQAERAIRQFSRPLRRAAARVALWFLGLVAMLGVAVALLSLVSPTVRARLFPPDLGLTAKYRVSSTIAGLPSTGIGTYARGEVFFHTNLEMRPHIDLDFGRPVRVRKVRIENRRDCCGERALPLDVKAVGKNGERFLCQRRAPFEAWTCEVGGVRTSRLRIEVPGTSMLHLRSVEVYE
jgi:hypothetical protein